MKKILALVLAFAMVFSTITVAFAEEEVVVAEVSAEAKALGTIGMLEGDGDGVTAEYTGKELNRLTAAIMILKLKGLYEDALKYDGVNNFADAEGVKWPEGKNILAYLKDNPTVGFGGNGKGEFNPTGTLSEQMLYKVLLENLGYKQVTADVADGDFAWDGTLEFAEKIGLKPAKAEKFTVDGLSKAVVAALKTNMKDGKAWIDVLVDAKKVDKDKAVVAGLMEEAKAVAVAVDSVTAIGNTVVEVVFEEDVDAAALENLDNYAIEGLEISEVVVAGTDTIRLTTTSMTLGKVYTLTVGEEKVKFTGVAKVTGAPKLEKAEGTDEQRVKLTFDKVLDFESASDVANYTIAGVTVVKAAVDGKTVTLTTEGLVANKNYTVKVANIESVDGGLLKSASKVFLAKTDKTAPKLDSAKAMTNTRVVATFNKNVTVASATDIANYTIKVGTEELAIEAIEMVKDSKKSVEITTAPQKSGKKYELVVNNIVDRKVLANTMTKEGKKTFYGKAEDKVAPTITGFTYLSKTLVEVTFNEASRLDAATALDANNYTFNNDIDVESVVFEDADNKDCKTMLLTVSELTLNKLYKLSIANVADEYGNAMEEGKAANSKSATFKASDLEAAKVKSVVASGDEIVVTFTKKLNSASAEEVVNYSVNNDVLVPVVAEYEANKPVTGESKVTLTTGVKLTAGKTYKLAIDGLLDLAGNTLKSTNSFVASATSIDTDAPEVEYVEALNANVVAVTFNEAMSTTGATISVDYNGNGSFEAGEVLDCVDSNDDDTVLYFTKKQALWTADADNGALFKVDYNTGLKDAAGNTLKLPDAQSDLNKVYGNTDEIDDLVLEGIEQTQVNEFKLYFSGKINSGTLAGLSPTGITFTSVTLDKDDKSIIIAKANYKVDTTYKVQLTSTLKGIFGEKVLGEYEEGVSKNQFVDLYAAMEDEDAPVIEKVEATYNNEVVVTYNENLRPGSYRYEIFDEDDKTVEVVTSSNIEDNEITLTLQNKKLVGGVMYTLVSKNAVYDLAGNKTTVDLDDKYYFEGTNLVADPEFITVNVVNRGTIKVVTNSGYLPEVTMAVYNGNTKLVPTETIPAKKSSHTWTLANVVFVDGVEYALWFGNEEVATFTGLAEVFLGGIVDDGTDPLEGVKVTLIKVVDGIDEVVDSAVTDADGKYEFSVTNASYKVKFEKTGYTTETSVPTPVADADVTVDKKLTVTP